MVKSFESENVCCFSGALLTRAEYVEELLKIVGKEVFVRNYHLFKKMDCSLYRDIDCGCSEESRKRRTACASLIFRHGLEELALKTVMNSKRVKPGCRDLARAIYSCEFDKDVDVLYQ